MFKKLNQNLFFKNNFPMIICLLIFTAITLPAAINESPFHDSGFAWHLSAIMNFDNVLQIIREEGHFILWYLILMPFSKNALFYPYSLQIINWFFCFLAVLIVWKKSPFNVLIKTVITFSSVIIFYFAIIARCYSVGLVGLFLIAGLFKDSLKKPKLFSVLSGLTANTSFFAAVPAGCFALMFWVDVIKEKLFFDKKYITALIIQSAFFGLIILPYLLSPPNIAPCLEIKDLLSVEPNIIYLPVALSYIFLFLYILFKGKSVKTKIFLAYSSGVLLFFLIFIYRGDLYHRFFFIIYLIIALWLDYENLKPGKKDFIFYIAFMTLMLFKFDLNFVHGKKIYKETGLHLQKSGNEFENSILIIQGKDFRYTLIPYITNNKKITLYDYKNSKNNTKFAMQYEINRFDEKAKNNIMHYAEKQTKPVYFFCFYKEDGKEPFYVSEDAVYDADKRLYIYKLN